MPTTKYAINAVQVAGLGLVFPGTLFSDQYDDLTRLANAGVLLWPSSDATVAAASVAVNAKRSSGITPEDAQGLMLAAVGSSNSIAAAAALAAAVAAQVTANAGVGVVKRTVTLNYSADDFAALSAGVKTKTKAIGAALPANARYVGHVVGSGSFTGFDDATHGTFTAKVGSSSDDDAIVSTVNVAAGQSGFPKAGTAGVRAFAQCPLYAEVHNLILTSSVDLNTATAGAITVDLFYLVLA